MQNNTNKNLLTVIIILLSIIILFGIFYTGYKVGSYHSYSNKSRMEKHGYSWKSSGKEFHRKGYWRNHKKRGFGAKGIIKQIEENIVTILGRDDIEKKVLITEETKFRNRNDDLTKDDISMDQGVVVIGEPNEEGIIEAKIFIIKELYW